jgi:hypothetical protein
MKTKILLLVSLVAISTITSCKKEEETIADKLVGTNWIVAQHQIVTPGNGQPEFENDYSGTASIEKVSDNQIKFNWATNLTGSVILDIANDNKTLYAMPGSFNWTGTINGDNSVNLKKQYFSGSDYVEDNYLVTR